MVLKSNLTKERGGYYHKTLGQFKNEHDAMVAWFKPTLPDMSDILSAYLNEAKDCTITFDSWCSEFGYNNDSIKALNIYHECQKIRDDLVNLFGYKLFEQLCSLEH